MITPLAPSTPEQAAAVAEEAMTEASKPLDARSISQMLHELNERVRALPPLERDVYEKARCEVIAAAIKYEDAGFIALGLAFLEVLDM
jgi:hypothetical protein